MYGMSVFLLLVGKNVERTMNDGSSLPLQKSYRMSGGGGGR
jgi:hypothetical protein